MSLWLTCQRLLVFFLGETRNGFEMLEGGSGIMWRYVTALPALHRSRSDLISISVKLLTIHTFTRTHTIYWLCLYKHAMRLHLRCVERHIKRGWFPQTDTPTLWQALTLLTGFMKTTSISNCCVWWRDKRSVQRVFSWLIVSLCLPVIIKMTQPPASFQSQWWHCKASSRAVIACPSAERIVLARELRAFVLNAEKSGVQPGRILAVRPGKWVI